MTTEVQTDWLRAHLYNERDGSKLSQERINEAYSALLAQITEALTELKVGKLQDLARFVDILKNHRNNSITPTEEFVRNMVSYSYIFGPLTPDVAARYATSEDEFKGFFDDAVAVARHFNEHYPKMVAGGAK